MSGSSAPYPAFDGCESTPLTASESAEPAATSPGSATRGAAAPVTEASARAARLTMSEGVLLDGVRQDLRRDLEAIEHSLAKTSGRWELRTGEAARHVLQGGGKKVRPLLTCSFLRALGRDPSPHIDLVAAVELAHTGSLLHDDIIDGAQMRRGRRAAHLVFNVPTAILGGDILLVEAIGRIASSPSRALRRKFSRALEAVCVGEALEREHLFNPMVDLALARRVNRLKTASLFAYAAEAGTVLGGAESRLRADARTYGLALGEAFQLTDDLLDFVGEAGELGKPIGQDLVTGCITVPLAIALKREPELRKTVLEIWTAGSKDGDGSEVVAALRRLRDSMDRLGALATTRRMALSAADRACSAVTALPSRMWRDQLSAFALAAAWCPEPAGDA